MLGLMRKRVEAVPNANNVSDVQMPVGSSSSNIYKLHSSLLLFQAAEMLGRQSMLWVVTRGDVRSNVSVITTTLGVTSDEAVGLIERMPVLLACEQAWLKLK